MRSIVSWWFTEQSQAKHGFTMLSAHLGAHLGVNGKVVGESIQCPFHGWQFGGDGKCNHIPYCDTIPTRAKVQNWPTSEVNGEIYMWFHPTGAEPDREVPVIEQIGDENWTEPRQVEFNIPVHIQDIARTPAIPSTSSTFTNRIRRHRPR